MNHEDLRALEGRIREEIPSFKLRFKSQSWLMMLVGALVYPFNQRFMDRYTTTVGSTVYFPSEGDYEADPAASVTTLAHEFVHLYDSREAGIKFQLGYTAPQLLALPFIGAYTALGDPWAVAAFIALYVFLATLAKATSNVIAFWVPFSMGLAITVVWAFFMSGALGLLLLAGIACLGPWPSPWRTRWELRGYSMNLALMVWRTGLDASDDYIAHVAKQFTGPNYWYMSGSSSVDIESQLRGVTRRALARQLEQEAPYSFVYALIREQDRVSRRPV